MKKEIREMLGYGESIGLAVLYKIRITIKEKYNE
jgi:hypothetical protein